MFAWWIQVPLALVYANLVEWLVHKYLLHRGKRKGSFWSHHFRVHHRLARRQGPLQMIDEGYRESFWKQVRTSEVLGLVVLVVSHLPLITVAPWFVGTLVFSAVNYFRVHRKAHTNPEWAAKWLPWHVDHHLGTNQDANWCVSFPLWDWILKTRIKR